eukprot:COSAG01_NODE_6284_length_3753_cov_4083.123974_6_plen_149_part_01
MKMSSCPNHIPANESPSFPHFANAVSSSSGVPRWDPIHCACPCLTRNHDCTAVLVRYDSTLLRTTLLKVPSQRRAVILADPAACSSRCPAGRSGPADRRIGLLVVHGWPGQRARRGTCTNPGRGGAPCLRSMSLSMRASKSPVLRRHRR